MSAISLASRVPASVQAKGRSYFRSGRVRNLQGTPRNAEATVVGSDLYFVSLELEKRNGSAVVEMWCDCPYYEANLSPCKHIWAVVLAADARGFLQGENGIAPTKFVVNEHYNDDEDDVGTSEYGHVFIRPNARTASPPKSPAPKKTPPPPWKNSLEELQNLERRHFGSRPAAPPSARQLNYHLDRANSPLTGRLYVEILVCERKKDGDWSKPKAQYLGENDLDSFADPVDRQIVSQLLGVERSANSYGGSYYSNPYSSGLLRFAMSPRLYESALALMCATGRCFVKYDVATIAPKPLEWSGSEPWRFGCAWSKSPDNKSYYLTGILRRGDETLPISAADTFLLPGLVVVGNRLDRVDDAGLTDWMILFQGTPRIDVPVKLKDQFLADLGKMRRLPTADFPEEFGISKIQEPLKPKIIVRQPREKSFRGKILDVDIVFQYGDIAIPEGVQGNPYYSADRRTMTVRDPDAEAAAYQRLNDAGVALRPAYGQRHWELLGTKLPKVARLLIQDGWIVEAEGKLYRSGGTIDIDVSTGIDWFELNAKVDFGDQSIPLPRLLQALRKGETIVQLDDGSYGLVPEDWLKKYGIFAEIGAAEGDSVRFSKTQVGLLDALLAAQPEATFDAGFTKAREQFRSFAGISPADAPPEFQGELRGYQREGLGWLHFMQSFGWGGCLADDMGLGKTVQVLAMLAERAANRPKKAPRPSLIVLPKSLLFNWKSEAARFAPQLKVLEHHASDRSKDVATFDDYDLVLTTYGIARKDAALFAERRFDYCILDESQAIKNASTEQAKAVRLLKADHRLAMSGTPVENHLGELWSLFEFLNPGMLGHASIFKLAGAGARKPEPETRDLLAKALRPFILRRTKDQVASDLPEKTEQTLYCDLEPEQRKLYDELRDYYRTALLGRIAEVGMNKAKIMVLEALLRLRQAACHPGLVDRSKIGNASAKLDILLPQLREVFEEGHKAIAFSQFTTFLGIVRKQLDCDKIPYEYLDGKTRDRQACVDRFQNDPDCKLFLISLKAGGVGLNLTAAEYVFILDPWWNPAVEAQAIDRAHRIGQTRPVFAYRLIAKDTVEEKVLELQKSKRALADAIINADNSLVSSLKKEDIELLLG